MATDLTLQTREPTVHEKYCPACHEVKRAALFYPNTNAADCLSDKCRSCCKGEAAKFRSALSCRHVLMMLQHLLL